MHASTNKQEILRIWGLSLAIAVFAVCAAWVYIANTPRGAPPDELAHLTYVQEIAEEGRWTPDYVSSKIINSSSGNYLSHPPLYYSLMGIVGRAFDWEAVADYRQFRFISALLVAAGLVLWAWTMSLWGWARIDTLTVVGAAIAVPMFSYLAGSVNNDNLAYLGVAIVLFALSARGIWPRSAYFVGALGVVVVMLGKATAAVFITILMLIWLFLRWRSGENLFRNRHFLIAISAAGIVCAAYYVPTLLVHGELFPTSGSLYESANPINTMGFGDYVAAFILTMIDRLPVVMSHQSYAPLAGVIETVFYAMLLVPLAAWLVSRPISPPSPRRDLSDAFMAALLGTVVLHFWVGWNGYQQTGLMAGIQPRYYSYALPGIFFFCFLDGFSFRVKRWAFVLFSAAVAACLAFGLASGAAGLRDLKEQPPVVSLTFNSSHIDNITISTFLASGEAGYVDQFTNNHGAISLRGWAIDAVRKNSSSGVLLIFEGRLIGRIPTGHARADVAKALDAPLALDSGFAAEITGAPVELNVCMINVLAQQHDGSLRRLRRPLCP